ncbi:uncharacterized protein LOC142980691 [Anticarsia gemmatalis]|uniref:uncharacterized protein LOC142980691 n=1 Tax=Anticarsia gemmatalis TaxID=129554 RepID=UPI003F75F4EC
MAWVQTGLCVVLSIMMVSGAALPDEEGIAVSGDTVSAKLTSDEVVGYDNIVGQPWRSGEYEYYPSQNENGLQHVQPDEVAGYPDSEVGRSPSIVGWPPYRPEPYPNIPQQNFENPIYNVRPPPNTIGPGQGPFVQQQHFVIPSKSPLASQVEQLLRTLLRLLRNSGVPVQARFQLGQQGLVGLGNQ